MSYKAGCFIRLRLGLTAAGIVAVFLYLFLFFPFFFDPR